MISVRSLFAFAVLSVLSSFATFSLMTRELYVLLLLCSECQVTVIVFNSSSRWHGLICSIHCMIVEFPDHFDRFTVSFFLVSNHKYNLHLCSCIIEFVNLVAKKG